MEFIKKVLKFFSRFTDPVEKEIYNFLLALKPKSNRETAKKRAQVLLQKDTARMTMILEWKFKGYTHLTKKYREQCYQNLALMKQDFEKFCEGKNPTNSKAYLECISQYLKPHKKIEYKAGASFDKLCKDPNTEKLVGDCNQLVALYVYLFSQKYDIGELQIKLMPGHVCLHHDGLDYEATTGDISQYTEFERLGNITEMIAVNLLDTADHSESQHELPAENKLQCAEAALVLSENQEIAQHNLDAAYHNMAIKKMNAKDFKGAAKWAEKTKDKSLLDVVLHNEAVYHLNHKHYDRSRKIFKRLSDKAGVKAVDQKELQSLVEKLKGCKTTADYKAKRTIIYKIKRLALTLHDSEMQKFCENILKQI